MFKMCVCGRCGKPAISYGPISGREGEMDTCLEHEHKEWNRYTERHPKDEAGKRRVARTTYVKRLETAAFWRQEALRERNPERRKVYVQNARWSLNRARTGIVA